MQPNEFESAVNALGYKLQIEDDPTDKTQGWFFVSKWCLNDECEVRWAQHRWEREVLYDPIVLALNYALVEGRDCGHHHQV